MALDVPFHYFDELEERVRFRSSSIGHLCHLTAEDQLAELAVGFVERLHQYLIGGSSKRLDSLLVELGVLNSREDESSSVRFCVQIGNIVTVPRCDMPKDILSTPLGSNALSRIVLAIL